MAQMNIKRLAGPTRPTSTTALYTVPASLTGAMVTSIIVSNGRSDSTVTTYGLFLVPSGATLDQANQALVSGRQLAPGDAPDVYNFQMSLNPGDSIYVTYNQTAIVFYMNGVTFS